MNTTGIIDLNRYYRLAKGICRRFTVKEIMMLCGCAAFNFLIYYGARLIAAGLPHFSLAVSYDEAIPFLPWTILVYWGCYPVWAVSYLLGTITGRGDGYRFLKAHYIGEAICFLFFVLTPTFMVRPEVTGMDLAARLIRFTYGIDAPDNLFPSIHCFASWLCWAGLRTKKRIPVWYKGFTFAMALCVCLCTLTVKQHVIADVLGGILLAELSYLLAGGFAVSPKNRSF